MLPMTRRSLPAVREDSIDTVWHDMMQMFDRWQWPEVTGEENLSAAYPVDVSEENGKILVDAELPGFDKKDIEVSVENGILQIKAERKQEEKKGKKHLHERRFTRVQRRFTLPVNVEDGKAVCKYDNGVLHLELPKAPQPKEHVIKIA